MSFTKEENPFETAEDWDVALEKMLEEGNYVCKIIQVEDGTAKRSGNPILEVRFQAESGAGTIRAWEPYHCEFLRRAATLYRAAGVRLPGRDEFDPSDRCRIKAQARDRLVSARVGVIVRDEQDVDPQTGLARKRTTVAGYCDPSRITGEIDTRGLPEPAAPSFRKSASDDDDLPF